jgi:hypothetical protein
VLAVEYKPENAEFAEKNGSFCFGDAQLACDPCRFMPVFPVFWAHVARSERRRLIAAT